MRIAFLVTKFPCLSETFILNQITGLIDRGHHVDVFAQGPAAEPKTHEDFVSYGLSNNTVYYGSATMPAGKLVRVAGGVKIAASQLCRRPDAVAKALNVMKYGRRAASLGLLYMISPFLKRRYDIVHCHFGPNGNVGVFLKGLGAIDAKVITSFHGFDMSSYLRQHGEHVYDGLFRNGDLFLPISEAWRQRLIGLGCDRTKILVHHMGIDTDRYRFRTRSPLPGGGVHILTVARLVEKKGVVDGVKAVAEVLRQHPQLYYTVIGDGPQRPVIERLIGELGVGHRVRLLGWKNQGEILRAMEAVHILLAPSVTDGRGDQEGIPVALMEAMAMGLPVVSTFHSGIPELVQDGSSGLLVPEGDSRALAAGLGRLIRRPDTWAAMAEEGRRRVEEEFDINKLNDCMVEHYGRLIAGNRARVRTSSHGLHIAKGASR